MGSGFRVQGMVCDARQQIMRQSYPKLFPGSAFCFVISGGSLGFY